MEIEIVTKEENTISKGICKLCEESHKLRLFKRGTFNLKVCESCYKWLDSKIKFGTE